MAVAPPGPLSVSVPGLLKAETPFWLRNAATKFRLCAGSTLVLMSVSEPKALLMLPTAIVSVGWVVKLTVPMFLFVLQPATAMKQSIATTPARILYIIFSPFNAKYCSRKRCAHRLRLLSADLVPGVEIQGPEPRWSSWLVFVGVGAAGEDVRFVGGEEAAAMT